MFTLVPSEYRIWAPYPVTKCEHCLKLPTTGFGRGASTNLVPRVLSYPSLRSERERDSGRNVTRPNQGLSTGRREKLGTRLCEYQNGSSRPCTRELMFVLANCVHTFSVSSKEIYCFVGRNGKIKRICYSYMSGIQSENTTSFRAVTQTLVLGHHL